MPSVRCRGPSGPSDHLGPSRQMIRGGRDGNVGYVATAPRTISFRLFPCRSLPSHISRRRGRGGRPRAVIRRAALGGEDSRRSPARCAVGCRIRIVPPPPSLWFAGLDLARLICSRGSTEGERELASSARINWKSSKLPKLLMASDISVDIRPDFNSFDHFLSMRYVATDRPWMKLYGIRIQPVPPFRSLSCKPDPALIHHCLPDELLLEIFTRMNPYTLGRAACVCRKWKYTTRNPTLWRAACLKTWQRSGIEANYMMVRSLYDSSWRRMWLQRPRIRIDGLYVSRNTYLHTGVTEWQFKKTVNVVCYYRYLRLFPSGKFLYKISPDKVKDAVKCMHFRASKADCVFKGDYILSEDGQIEMALLYPGHRYTLVRMRLRLRGTTIGANNRLDVLKILTTGVNATELKNWTGSILELVEGWEEDETHDPDVPAVSHSRGLSPFVFVPFEEVETSVLNLPVEKMDYYVPG